MGIPGKLFYTSDVNIPEVDAAFQGDVKDDRDNHTDKF
jgi:hypothetical protein